MLLNVAKCQGYNFTVSELLKEKTNSTKLTPPPLLTRILHFMILCVIWCHLQNVKNEKNIHRGVLLLVKVTLLHRCFSRVLNCTSGAKFHKASHVMITILAFWDIIPYSLSLIKPHLEIGTPFQGTFNKSKSSRSVQVHLGNEIR